MKKTIIYFLILAVVIALGITVGLNLEDRKVKEKDVGVATSRRPEDR